MNNMVDSHRVLVNVIRYHSNRSYFFRTCVHFIIYSAVVLNHVFLLFNRNNLPENLYRVLRRKKRKEIHSTTVTYREWFIVCCLVKMHHSNCWQIYIRSMSIKLINNNKLLMALLICTQINGYLCNKTRRLFFFFLLRFTVFAELYTVKTIKFLKCYNNIYFYYSIILCDFQFATDTDCKYFFLQFIYIQ